MKDAVQRLANMLNSNSPQVPFTIIAGFLGSGKTTLLNHVLAHSHGVRFAVMVNDFGELAIDEALILEHDGDTISFANGCVCCTLGDNLIASIDALLQREPAPEQFLVEVSGVANPKGLADVATLHPGLRRDLVITLADASAIVDQFDDVRLAETLHRHLQHADLVVLNKCDLVDDAQIQRARQRIIDYSQAPVVETEDGRVPTGLLSGDDSDVITVNEDVSDEGSDEGSDGSQLGHEYVQRLGNYRRHSRSLENEREHEREHEHEHEHGQGQGQGNRHGHTDAFYKASVVPASTLSVETICTLLKDNRSELVRAKGFVICPTNGDTWLIQLSGSRVQQQRWPTSSMTAPGLVLIGLSQLDEIVNALS